MPPDTPPIVSLKAEAPRTANVPEDVAILRERREVELDTVLTNATRFGGMNATPASGRHHA